MGAACLLASVSNQSAHAQQQPSAMELLGKAQSQSERQSVEDLINKLQGRTGANPAPAAPPPPAAIGASAPPTSTPPASSKPLADTVPQAPPATAPAVVAAPAAPPAAPTPAAVSVPAPLAVPAAAATIEPILPSADIFVYFDFGSVAVDPKAADALSVLGLALSDARLAKAVFLIAGHTDAKGKPDFNLDLSQRRAEAVRQHLITAYGLAPSRLVALGFGDTRLNDPLQPQSDVNRRVQVVNVTAFAQP